MELAEKKCVPCEGNMQRLEGVAVLPYLKEINDEWYMADGKRIRRKFRLQDFKETIQFVNSIADVAEAEGHHPDLCIFWNILEVSLWTHAIGGLSENDFIMAAKIVELYNHKFSGRTN